MIETPRFIRILISCLLSSTGILAPAFGAGVAPWIPTGPAGGRLYTATLHPGSPGSIWLGWPGGLFRSADRGAHWTRVQSPATPLDAVAADARRAGTLWGANGKGFFRSEDGGSRWTQVAGVGFSALVGTGTSPRAILPTGDILYVFTSRRVLASADGGVKWAIRYDLASLGDTGWIQALAVDPPAAQVLYLSIFGPDRPALLRSADGGLHWAELTHCPVPDSGLTQLLVTAQGVYVAMEDGAPGLYRSVDSGETWQALLGGPASTAFDVHSLAADPRQPRTLYLVGALRDREFPEVSLLISRNAGRTWGRIAEAPAGEVLADAAGTLYARSDTLLQRSGDGGVSWVPMFRAPSSESTFAHLDFWLTNPSSLALTVGSRTFRSADGGRAWRLVNTPSPLTDLIVAADDPNHLIAADFSSVFVSGDGGRSWRKTVNNLWYVERLVRIDAHTLLAAGAGMYRSIDDGESWQTVLPGWAPGSDVGRWTQKVEADAAGPSQVYALTFLIDNLEFPHGVLADSPSALWRSSDSGRTWKKTAASLRTFAVGSERSRVYGVRNRDLLQSSDAGRTWVRIASMPALVHALVVDARDPDTLYAAGSGLWRSRDRGATWVRLASAWTPATLELHPSDRSRLFGADSTAVFELRVPQD